MNILITGAAGFIGSHLTDALLADGHRVWAIDRSGQNIERNLKPHENLRVHEVDINGMWIAQPDKMDIDCVVHLAALADIVPSIERPTEYFDTNVTGTLRVLEAARAAGVKKFVYAASSSCYGANPQYPTKEHYECSPQYPYALTKRMGEQLVEHWGNVYKMPWASLRLFNVYGPRSRTNGAYGAVFGTFLAQKLAGKPFTIVGDGLQSRDFIYVSDVVEAFKAVMFSSATGIYNVGTGQPKTIRRLTQLLGPNDSVHIPERPGEPRTTCAAIGKLARLGWQPKVSFDEGVAIMLENIDYWKCAPVWDVESIAKATERWFDCLGAS